MILSIIVIVLVLAIAFIHLIQGFFSAALSAIIALIAASVAIGYQESLVNLMKPGKFADDAAAAFMCLLFIVTYVLLRVIVDKAVPGNVRLLPTVDKVGAAVMGLIAGVFAAGVIAIAMQAMPFHSGSLQARYLTVAERDASGSYRPGETQLDRKLFDQVKSATFVPGEVSKLIIPADDWTLATVAAVSGGTLSTQSKFSDIHPDYLQELFGQRVGIQPGSKHTVNNYPGGDQQVSLEGVWYMGKAKQLPAQDAGNDAIRKADKEPTKALSADMKDKPLVVVAVRVQGDTIDSTNTFSFSPGSVRLVIHPEGGPAQNVFPIGTMEAGKLWLNRIDDYMFANGGAQIQFVFPLEKLEDVVSDETKDPQTKRTVGILRPGTFIEVKRYGRIDLAGGNATPGAPPPITGTDVARPLMLKTPPKTN